MMIETRPAPPRRAALPRPTRSERLREQAGLSLAEAAFALDVTPRDLRACERRQDFRIGTAERLVRLYRARGVASDLNDFLPGAR